MNLFAINPVISIKIFDDCSDYSVKNLGWTNLMF